MPDEFSYTPPPPGAAPVTTPAAPETPAPDTGDADADLIIRGLYGEAGARIAGTKPKPAGPDEGQPKPKADAKPPEATPAPAPPAAPSATATPAPPPPPPDADDIAARVAERLKSPPPPAKPTPRAEDPDAAFEEEDKHKLKVLRFLGEQEPAKKGLETQYRTFLAKEKDYVSKWEAAHPNEEFDGESDEHSAFYEKHQPDIEDGVIRRWETEMIAEERAQKIIQRQRDESDRRSINETIRSNIQETARVIEADLLEDSGAKKGQKLEELREEDPLAAEAVEEVAGFVHPLLAASEQLLTPGTSHAYNAKDPAHQELVYRVLHPPETGADGKVRLSYEGEIAALSETDRQWTGADGVVRQFVTRDQWNGLTPEQRSRAWTLVHHPEIVASFLRRDARAAVKHSVAGKHAAAKKLAEKLGYKAPSAGPNGVQPGEELTHTPATPSAAPAPPPSLGSSAQPVTTLTPPSTTSDNLSELIQKGLYGI